MVRTSSMASSAATSSSSPTPSTSSSISTSGGSPSSGRTVDSVRMRPPSAATAAAMVDVASSSSKTSNPDRGRRGRRASRHRAVAGQPEARRVRSRPAGSRRRSSIPGATRPWGRAPRRRAPGSKARRVDSASEVVSISAPSVSSATPTMPVMFTLRSASALATWASEPGRSASWTVNQTVTRAPPVDRRWYSRARRDTLAAMPVLGRTPTRKMPDIQVFGLDNDPATVPRPQRFSASAAQSPVDLRKRLAAPAVRSLRRRVRMPPCSTKRRKRIEMAAASLPLDGRDVAHRGASSRGRPPARIPLARHGNEVTPDAPRRCGGWSDGCRLPRQGRQTPKAVDRALIAAGGRDDSRGVDVHRPVGLGAVMLAMALARCRPGPRRPRRRPALQPPSDAVARPDRIADRLAMRDPCWPISLAETNQSPRRRPPCATAILPGPTPMIPSSACSRHVAHGYERMHLASSIATWPKAHPIWTSTNGRFQPVPHDHFTPRPPMVTTRGSSWPLTAGSTWPQHIFARSTRISPRRSREPRGRGRRLYRTLASFQAAAGRNSLVSDMTATICMSDPRRRWGSITRASGRTTAQEPCPLRRWST